MNRNRWNLRPKAPPEYFASASSFPPLVAQLLYNRGLTDATRVRSFLSGDASLLADPFLLPDMSRAVDRIHQALRSGEHVVIYGDFDADGITATALLVQGLTVLGGKTSPYIPHRVTEGHGLRQEALRNLKQEGASLVITVDCGTTNLAEIEAARQMGLEVIVTDHHTPVTEMPPALAIVNPKLNGSAYPFSELSGVGVALKLFQAVLDSLGKNDHLHGMMDLAALGTVADMSPMVGENRFLVKEGLKVINESPRLGIKAIMTQARITAPAIDTEHISWVIAPYLNASGRMEHAMSSYKLLMTGSAPEACQLAARLEQKNDERKKLTSATFARAREQVLVRGISPLLLVSGKDYPIGVAGLVASKLTDEFYRPSVVIELGEKVSSGSCRSIPEFNIVAALGKCADLLTQFGGHSQAAGFTLPTVNLPRLQHMLGQMAETHLAGADLRPTIDIDAGVALPELAGDTFQLTQQLAPFGRGNPPPTYLSHSIEVLACRTMGLDNGHLRLKVKQSDSIWNAVAFGLGHCCQEVAPFMDIVYNLEVDRWGGRETLRLNILDFAPAK